MKKIFIILTYILYSQTYLFGQQAQTDSLSIDSLFKEMEQFSNNDKAFRRLRNIVYIKKNGGEYSEAAIILEKLFKYKKHIYLIYNAACYRTFAGDKEKAFFDLNLAIEYGFVDKNLLKRDKDLLALHDSEEWNMILKKIEHKINVNYPFFLDGLFFGMLIILFIYNVFLFISTRERSLLFYSLFIFFLIHFNIIYIDNFFSHILFPWIKYTVSMKNSFMFFVNMVMIFYVLYAISFLNLKTASRRSYKISLVFISYLILTLPFTIFITSPLKFIYEPLPSISILIFVFGISIKVFIKGFKPAKYFIIANLALVIGAVMLSLRYYKLISLINFFAFDPVQIGMILFLILLSLAIGYKINFLKSEVITANKKALIHLEEKVKERTKEIKEKNEELNQLVEEVTSQKEEIEKQHTLVSKQKDEIISSITYAERIQKAVLPSKEYANEVLPEYFILFKPRDIVSGDFYWMKQLNNFVCIATADCTGHGVPGAFMSMLGSSFLNEIVTSQSIDNTGEILNRLRKKVKQSLKQDGKEGEQKDGMDIAFYIIDTKTLELKYSGAYNPLYIIRENMESSERHSNVLHSELITIKANRQPIAIHIKETEFETQHFQLQKGDCIYTFSDGYPDQFGGEKGGKFKTGKFKKLLLEIYAKPMYKQKEILNKTLKDWMKEQDQTDDILIVGVRI